MRTCGVPREELFVVSKVAAEHKTYEQAKNEEQICGYGHVSVF